MAFPITYWASSVGGSLTAGERGARPQQIWTGLCMGLRCPEDQGQAELPLAKIRDSSLRVGPSMSSDMH